MKLYKERPDNFVANIEIEYDAPSVSDAESVPHESVPHPGWTDGETIKFNSYGNKRSSWRFNR